MQRTARKLSGDVRYSKSGPVPTGSESRVPQMQQCAASVTSGRVETGRAGGSVTRDRDIASTTVGIVPTRRRAVAGEPCGDLRDDARCGGAVAERRTEPGEPA